VRKDVKVRGGFRVAMHQKHRTRKDDQDNSADPDSNFIGFLTRDFTHSL
jgi:hypothetical protein